MTKVEEAIIRFIIDYYKKIQFYPNYDEIAAGTEMTKSDIRGHMENLEAEGVIVREPGHPSEYRLMNMGFICRHLPVVPESYCAGIREQIKGMVEHVCDRLCKYPDLLKTQDELDDVCDECELGGYVCRMLNMLEKYK